MITVSMITISSLMLGAGCTASQADSEDYAVIPLSDGVSDWQVVPFINQLLGQDWTVYRNTAPIGGHAAGSFFIPLGGLPLSKDDARSYLETGMPDGDHPLIFHEERLPEEGLEELVRPRVAVFYATGQKWAVMTAYVLEEMGFDAAVLSAEDISGDALNHFNVLFIPGGSHTDKATEVGPEGEASVKAFAERGGGVLGFCGGAALTLQVSGGWNMVTAERYDGKKPLAMHGPIWIKPETSDHPVWYGYGPDGVPLAPWFGGAFQTTDDSVSVLGRYDRPTDDFYMTQSLNGYYFSELLPQEMATLDEIMNGYADPALVKGLVAMVEGQYGQGKVVLGYPHPETAGLTEGYFLLANAVYYVATTAPEDSDPWLPKRAAVLSRTYQSQEILELTETAAATLASQIKPVSRELTDFGNRNFYWTPHAGIPWCYIYDSDYPANICERLEIYSDEIGRNLDDIPRLAAEIESKYDELAALQIEDKDIAGQLDETAVRIRTTFSLTGATLTDINNTYFAEITGALPDWAAHYKQILLYRQLLAIAEDKDAAEDLISELSTKNRDLTSEYLGGWRWTQSSDKYRAIFIPLDDASYYLTNLKSTLTDIARQLDYLRRLAGN